MSVGEKGWREGGKEETPRSKVGKRRRSDAKTALGAVVCRRDTREERQAAQREVRGVSRDRGFKNAAREDC